MLVQTDDTRARLAPVESRKRTQQTEADSIRQANQADVASVGGLVAKDLERAARQIGRALHVTDVERRLRTIVPNIHFEVARMDPDLLGVYLLRPKGWDPTRPDETRDFVGRMHRGPWVPEFQVYKPKTLSRPDPTIKGHEQDVQTIDDMLWGWRTVLARLIRRGVITPGAAERAFGLPTLDQPEWQMRTQYS